MDENSALSKYIGRFLTSWTRNVLKTAILNFGYEAMFCGTKKI